MSRFALTKSLTVIGGAALLSLYSATALAQPATDVDCFRCVNTIDIDIGAVTTNRIAPGAVTTDRIAPLAIGPGRLAPGAVTTDKIPLRAIGTGRLALGAVTTDRLAIGAVKTRRIADGTITAAKLGLANTVYLEDTGSNTDNCTDLLDALTGLTGPAAVVLGPGTYDCGSSPVVLPADVGLIGSGQKLTTIKGSVDSFDGLVRLADDTELRDLTVVNDDSGGAGNNFVAVVIGAGSVDTQNWRISDVTVRAMSGDNSRGIFALNVNCGVSELINVTATANGALFFNVPIDIQCTAGSITGTNLSATASDSFARGLMKFNASSLTVRNSSFVGATNSVSLQSGTLKVISSELAGPLFGAVICVGAYDGGGNALEDGTFGTMTECM